MVEWVKGRETELQVLTLGEYETGEYESALRHLRRWASRGWSGTSELIDVATFHFALLLIREGKFIEGLFLLAGQAEKFHSGAALTEAMGLASLRMRNLPEDYPPEKREMVWLAGKAAFYAALRPPDYARADEYAGRLKQHYQENANVHYFLGTLLRFESKDEEAAREFLKELEISPQHAAAMIELARLDLNGSRPQDGLARAKSACAIEPRNPEAHRIYGALLLKLQKFGESAHELEIAARLAPDSALVRFQLATAYRKLNRPRDAARETAAFNLLKDKQQVIASPEEKLGRHPELLK